LFGPNAQLIADGGSYYSSSPITLPATGTYYLSIEGQWSNGDTAATNDPYAFTLFQSTPTTTPVNFGQPVNTTFTPGSVSRYTVNVTAPGWLKFDSLSSTGVYANWTLFNAAGQ